MKSFKNIALLPLDNRPPNYLFPAQLARIAGTNLLLPPREFLGNLYHGAQRESLERWLLQLPAVDAVVIAIDTLAFGGLAQSRQMNESLEDALKHLDILLQWRAQHPDVPIFAFNVLMRLGITMASEAVAVTHFNLQRYSRLADEAEHFHSEYLKEQLAGVTAQISSQVLAQYLATRQRNHQLNLEMVHWVARHQLDFLCLVQEDCAEFGLHRQEQNELNGLIAELNLREKTSLHPGTDEAAMMLLARLQNTESTFRVHWSTAQGAAQIPPFEDRPLSQTLQAQLKVANCHEMEDGADFELFINAPLSYARQQETVEQQRERAVQLQHFVREMELALEQNQHVALCDAAFPNGADDTLMNLLDERNLLGKVCAFAGWNTASNSLGTVLAKCVAFTAGDFSQDELNQNFVLERILDDWIYQTRVRAQMEKRARSQEISPLKLGDYAEELARQAEREMRGFAQLITQRHFKRRLKSCRISFPWERTFEIELNVE